MMNKKQTAILGTLLASALVGCGPVDDRVKGGSVDFNGGQVTTWTKLDAQGVVEEVGFTLPYTSIENAPTGSGHEHPVIFIVDFPEEVRKTTFIDHLEFDWMPGGHEPERYMTPHFDFHFFGVDKATTAALDCTNPAQPDPADIPEGWLPPVPPDAADPTLFCHPHMGYHSAPISEFESPGVFKPGLFDKVMIPGYYDGKLIFVEPMVAKAELEKKQSFTLPVPQPKSVGRATLFPTTFNATFDADANAYQFVLGGFKSIQ